MAQSSPGQPRPFHSMGQLTTTGSLSDMGDGPVHFDEDAEALFEQQEAPLASQTSPARGIEHQHDLPGNAGSYPASTSTMLLERPSSLFKPLDLDKGYEYGPAVQFAPGYFTKMPGKSTITPQDNQSRSPGKDTSPRPAPAHHAPASYFPSQEGRGRTENAASTKPAQPGPATRSRELPPKAKNGVAERNSNNHVAGSTPVKHIPPPINKPPFPDTSPESSEQPLAQPKSLRVENNFAATLSKLSMRFPMPANTPTQASEAPSGQKPNVSSPMGHGYNGASPHHATPEADQRALHPRSRREERDQERQPPPVPPVERTSHSKRESADAAQNHMANRPLKDWTHVRPARPSHQTRPVSRGSNVSKQRSRCGSLASSPMIRQRRININHDFTTSLAGAINQFTHEQNATLVEQKDKYHKYIKRLRKDLDMKSKTVDQQASKLEAQANDIQSLGGSNEQLAGQLRDVTAKLRVSDDHARKLKEKYDVLKDHLNKALLEQQDLYTRTTKRLDDTVEQIRGTEKSQSAKAEMAVRNAEAIREEMMEKVRQAVAQNKSEALELYGKIERLTRQVKEKEVELRQERESGRALAQQLEALRATSNSFEALASQGKEILTKLGEQQEKADEEYRKSTEDTRIRLDALTKRLEALFLATTDHSTLLTGIRQAQDESSQSTSAKLDHIIASGDKARDAADGSSTNVEQRLGEIWQRLDGQIESLTEQLAKTAKDNGMITTLYKRKDTECEEYIREVDELRERTEAQAHRIQELEANLATLGVAQDENEELIRRLERTQTEAAQLRDAIKSKETAVAEMQHALDTRQKEHSAEVERYNSEIEKLCQEKGAAAQEASAAARLEAREEMEGANRNTMKLLGESQQQINSLVRQLENLKRDSQQKEQSGLQDTATIRSLHEALSAEESKREAAAEQLAQRSRDQEELEVRMTSTVNGLEAQLDISRDRVVELEDERRRQCARSEGLVTGLKLWAHQEGLDIHDLDCLGEVNDSAEDVSAGLARVLSQMLRGRNTATLSNPPPWQADSRNQLSVGQPTNGYAGVAMGGGAESDAAVAENEFRNNPVPYASTLHHMRRVVVCSPANAPEEPAIPSIDQEKARRREAAQPKSILKRVTRSASNMLKEAAVAGITQNGAFKRSKRDNSAGRHASTPNASEAGAAESISVAPSRRSSKRRRSETAKPDNAPDAFGGTGQGVKPEPSSWRTEQYQVQVPNTNGSRGFQPAPTLDSQRNSGTVPGLQRQPNIRTYGSQRSAAEPGFSTPGSQFPGRSESQSQSQSRYWPRHQDESQESVTFSQSVGGDENLLLSC